MRAHDGPGLDYLFPLYGKLLRIPPLSVIQKAMVVLVPEPKRLVNLAKHRIDLADFEAGFNWDRDLAGPAKPSRTGRARERYIASWRVKSSSPSCRRSDRRLLP